MVADGATRRRCHSLARGGAGGVLEMLIASTRSAAMLHRACTALAAAACAAAAAASHGAPVACPAVASQLPLTCPSGSECCKGRFWGGPNVCSTGTRCNTCAECCHDAIGKNQSDCDTCFHTNCKSGSYGKAGCRKVVAGKATGSCCLGGQPGFPSITLPNCLLIGDSVAHGTFGLVKEKLKGKCALANIEGVTSGQEDSCAWSTLTGANDGLPVKWAVIHYNEGLHSLWPRYNTSKLLNEYATNLGHLTDDLKETGARCTTRRRDPTYFPNCRRRRRSCSRRCYFRWWPRASAVGVQPAAGAASLVA